MGKITVVKSLVVSKLVHLFISLPSPPIDLIKQLNSMLYKFIWNDGPDRIKRQVLWQKYKAGGQQMINLDVFIKALKVSWMKRLLFTDGNWQMLCSDVVLSDLTDLQCLGANFIDKKLRNVVNPFWRDTLIAWRDYSSNVRPRTRAEILSEPLWYNSNLNHSMYIDSWYQKHVVRIRDLFDENGKLYTFERFKAKYRVRGTFLDYFRVTRLIPKAWLDIVSTHGTLFPLVTPITRSVWLMLANKKGSRYAYDVLLPECPISASELKWQTKLKKEDIDWEKCYMLPRLSTDEVKLWNTQYKILRYILPTNYILKKMGLLETELCTFCDYDVETIEHLFIGCHKTKQLWQHVLAWLNDIIQEHIVLTDSDIILGFGDANSVWLDNILLLVKQYIYSSRCKGMKQINIEGLVQIIKYSFRAEAYNAEKNNNTVRFIQKWGYLAQMWQV